MKFIYLKSIIILTLLLSLAYRVEANSIVYYLKNPKFTIANSLFNELSVYDGRERGLTMGIIKRRTSGTDELIMSKTPIAVQIENMFNKAIEKETAQSGKLVLHLLKYDLALLSNNLYDRAFFDFKAILYENKDGRLSVIANIDKKIMINESNVAIRLINKSSEIVAHFITSNVFKTSNIDKSIKTDDLSNLGQLLKDNLPLYRNEKLIDGVYLDWDSFKNQIPAHQLLDKDNNIDNYYVDANGKKRSVNSKRVYAYVNKNQAYVVTKSGNYPLSKMKDEYHFDGKLYEYNNASNIISGLYKNRPYRLKLDPTDGTFIKIPK